MADPYDEDDQILVLDFVDDPVVTDADSTKTTHALEGDAAVRTRVLAQRQNTLVDAVPSLVWK
jgi:hypothetical protein